MILIGANQLAKSFAARLLFQDISFSISEGDRVGLVGPNGAGKSTLLRILAGQMEPDAGSLSKKRGLRVGYLEQVVEFPEGLTIRDAVMNGAADPDDWEAMARAEEWFSRLELVDKDLDSPAARLSGGWQKKVALAREFMREPDLLLLDEPTNHLDVESILWLEEMLSESPIATLTVTHDRLFLQKVSTRIVELNRRYAKGVLSIQGSYADFLEAREQQFASQESTELKLQNTLRRETEWLRRGAKARQTKQQARIKGAEKLKQTVEDLARRNDTSVVQMDLQSTDKSPKKLIEATGITKAFGARSVVPKIDLLIGPKTRLGLVGPNGCGKTTLLRILTGELAPDSGSVFHADQLQFAYFSQSREALDLKISVQQTLCPVGDFVDEGGKKVHVRSYLSRFLFSPQQMELPVAKLSGGERGRLLLAQLLLTPANVLVLDEPTNDLDMETQQVLMDQLREFKGAVILVTHDRYFLDQMAHQILAFGINSSGGPVIDRMVGLEQWMDWHETQVVLRQKLAGALASPKAGPPHGKQESSPPSATSSSASVQRKRSLAEDVELQSLEKKLAELESQLLALQSKPPDSAEKSEAQAKAFRQWGEEVQNLTETRDQLMARWMLLESLQPHAKS